LTKKPVSGARALTVSETLCAWSSTIQYEDLPPDVVEQSQLRILDVLGLVLLARRSDVGSALLRGARSLGGPAEASIVGEARAVGAATAALANGAMAEAIEFDDTHTESIVHVGAAVVGAALATAEAQGSDGQALLLAVATGAEAVCRIGVVAPGGFHPRGFHPTGIICPFGAALAAGSLMGLSLEQRVWALGIAGSQAAGLLECWADGTWAKVVHPGWAAHSAIIACRLAAAGFTGPARILEGAAGLFASHIQQPSHELDLVRAQAELGQKWECRGIAFKPYPNAHVIHGLTEAALQIACTIDVDEVEEIVCAVAPHWIPIVCEPMAEKRRPPNTAQARISLPHCIAEALVTGRMDAGSFAQEQLLDPSINALADKIRYEPRRDWTDKSIFPGEIRVRLNGKPDIVSEVAFNLGGHARPLGREAIVEKFRANASDALASGEIESVVAGVFDLPHATDARALAGLCLGSAD